MTQPCIDMQVLAEIFGGDAAMERRACAYFLETSAIDAVALHEALAAGDVAAAARIAHRLKGASNTIGALPLGTACNAVERACRAGDRDAAVQAMSRAGAELDRLRVFVETRSRGNAAR
jgi:HPt (histidine-containing phosphotransfer) domain-containing protein